MSGKRAKYSECYCISSVMEKKGWNSEAMSSGYVTLLHSRQQRQYSIENRARRYFLLLAV